MSILSLKCFEETAQVTILSKFSYFTLIKFRILFSYILRKTIEGYLVSVPSLTSNTIKALLSMNAFHSSRHLQSNWMLYFSHASMV